MLTRVGIVKLQNLIILFISSNIYNTNNLLTPSLLIQKNHFDKIEIVLCFFFLHLIRWKLLDQGIQIIPSKALLFTSFCLLNIIKNMLYIIRVEN